MIDEKYHYETKNGMDIPHENALISCLVVLRRDKRLAYKARISRFVFTEVSNFNFTKEPYPQKF